MNNLNEEMIQDSTELIKKIQSLVSREKAEIVSKLYPHLNDDARNFKRVSEIIGVSRETLYKWSDKYGYKFREQNGDDSNV